WIGAGASKEAFEADAFPLLSEQGHHPITAEFVDINPDGTPHAKIASIFAARCARCHQQGAGGPAAQIPLETWEEVHAYCEVDTRAGGMSVQKLAQSTHVHLLSLSVLYGLTGLLFTFTTYPGWVRGVLAPLPLLAQLAEISCWWLARMDPSFGAAIVVLGGAVAIGLLLHIALTLLNMFGRAGRVLLLCAVLGAGVGGYVLKEGIVN